MSVEPAKSAALSPITDIAPVAIILVALPHFERNRSFRRCENQRDNVVTGFELLAFQKARRRSFRPSRNIFSDADAVVAARLTYQIAGCYEGLLAVAWSVAGRRQFRCE